MMILGIISAVSFIIICLRFVDKRFIKNKRMKLFSKIHIPMSFLFIVVTVLHLAVTFPLFNSRPVSALLTGLLGLITALLSFYSGFKKKIKIHRISALFACFFIILHIVFNISGLVGYQGHVRSIVVENIDISSIPDGIYVGEYDVTYIFVKVEVTVKSGEIIDISIIEHRNERGKPAEHIVNDIIEKQKINVDAVSSATNSSTVIKKAVENALQGVRK